VSVQGDVSLKLKLRQDDEKSELLKKEGAYRKGPSPSLHIMVSFHQDHPIAIKICRVKLDGNSSLG
jgi:hypothetical protein